MTVRIGQIYESNEAGPHYGGRRVRVVSLDAAGKALVENINRTPLGRQTRISTKNLQRHPWRLVDEGGSIMRVRSRPAQTSAVMVTEANAEEVVDWLLSVKYDCEASNDGLVRFYTVDGNLVHAKPGTFVVLDSEGWPYPCHPDAFNARWERLP